MFGIKKKNPIGMIAFIIAVVGSLAIGLLGGIGLFEANAIFLTVMVVAGVVVGFMNISEKESVPVMISALMVGIGAIGFAMIPFVGVIMESMFTSLASAVLPIGMVVAVSTIWKKSQAN